ncbi:hemerythrin domain-containing protein [Kushneria aurantia]|uniref:Hemerythrin domain-containing protein n=1 Tax=Kushneria aurantia TaxID=504092 RepID=A0ABV6G5Q1_9GAMM|nr:hemerythrin domain-containing protein [Kushneria aurantia]
MFKLNQLRQDHARMVRLLHVLSLQHRRLVTGNRPDFRLMREACDYIGAYLDDYLMPLEMLCGNRLAERGADSGQRICEMAGESRALRQRLVELEGDLESILMDAVIPMALFTERLAGYLDAHRHYLRQERDHLFPLLDAGLDEQEYAELRDALPIQARTRFARLQQDYPELYAEFRNLELTGARAMG